MGRTSDNFRAFLTAKHIKKNSPHTPEKWLKKHPIGHTHKKRGTNWNRDQSDGSATARFFFSLFFFFLHRQTHQKRSHNQTKQEQEQKTKNEKWPGSQTTSSTGCIYAHFHQGRVSTTIFSSRFRRAPAFPRPLRPPHRRLRRLRRLRRPL